MFTVPAIIGIVAGALEEGPIMFETSVALFRTLQRVAKGERPTSDELDALNVQRLRNQARADALADQIIAQARLDENPAGR